MPSFLSKVFGRKRDEKGSSPVRVRGYDAASLLEGKFEVVSLVGSPTIGEFPENAPRFTRGQNDQGLSTVKEHPLPSSSTQPSNRKDGFPHLPLSLPLSQEEAQARALGTGFERYSDAQFLSDASIGERRLTPLETLILVRICSQAIVARGLETLGLMHPYWYSASPETQHRLISLFIRSLNANSPQSSADISSFSLFESEINYTLSPHDVAAVLRWGLRHLELGAAGFGNEKTWYRTFAEAERKAGYPPQTYSETLAPLIPAAHLELLDATLDLFSSLAAHSEENSTSASKLTRAFGFWLLVAQRDRERGDWANFYDRWQSSGRALEHVFLARIRNESLRTRMPTRLTGLVTHYPYVEGETMEDDIFLHLQLSTRQFEALLVRVESELSSQEQAHRHPLQLVKDALAAQVMNADDTELASFWERMQKSGNDESEVTPGGYPGIGRIFTDDTLRHLSLVPGNHPWTKSTSATFNLREVQDSPIFRRLASSPGSNENEGVNHNRNGHAKYISDPASPSSAETSASPSDWFQFSSAGFTDASPSALPLASTLFGQDVEKTHPPSRNKRPTKIRSRSPSRARKSGERGASPPPPVPPVPDLPQSYSQKPTFKSTPISLVEIDEAFIDFWVDALLDPVSSNWPKFVLCKLRPDLPDVTVNNQRVEYIIIEYLSGLITPQQATSSSATPITIPSTFVEHNELERTTSPTKSVPSSPRSFRSDKQRFFSFFSSTTGARNSASYASATTSRGKKPKETVSSPPEREREREVGDFGEIKKEKEGKSSSVVKLRMPSPKPRRSAETPRRARDPGGSNVDVTEQVRGRSMGEKELEKLKELERKRREAEEKMVKEAEKKREAEEKKREAEEKKKKEAEDKKREAEEKKREAEEKKREAEEKKREAGEKKKKEAEDKKREAEDKKREAEERKREAEEKKKETEGRKRRESEDRKRKESLPGISSVAASAVAAAAVAVATVTTGGSQQAMSREAADSTEDNRSAEEQTEESVAEQELEDEDTTPVDSEVTNFEEQQSRLLETIVESPTSTEPTPVLTSKMFSAPLQQARDARNTSADHFFDHGVVESAIQPSAPREHEIRAVAEPIEEANPVSEHIAPEPVAGIIEELISPQEDASTAQPVVVQATSKPITAGDYTVVEEPVTMLPPGLEPPIALAKGTQEPEEPEVATILSDSVQESTPDPVAPESAATAVISDSRPDRVELTPVTEESIEDIGAEPGAAAEVPLATPKPIAAEEFLIIEGPAAFDPSDIDAQIEEMNALIPEEIGDSESTSEEDSVATEEHLPVNAEELAPIQEADEGDPNFAEDSIEDVVVIQESAALEAPVEEATEDPSVLPVVEAAPPILVPGTLVAEEKDDVVPFAEEEEQEAEAALIEEEPIDEIMTITEPSEAPAPTPVVEPPSVAADEFRVADTPPATLDEPLLADAVEEIEPPTQEVSPESVTAIEAAPEVEESAIAEEEAVVEEAVPVVEEEHILEDVVVEEDSALPAPTEEEDVPGEPPAAAVFPDEQSTVEEQTVPAHTEAVVEKTDPAVEEEHIVEDVVIEEDSAFPAPTEEEVVPSETPAAAVFLDEHSTIEEPAVATHTEVTTPERLVAGDVSDEANGSEVVPSDPPIVVEEIGETLAEGEPTVEQPALAESAPVEHVAFEEPEVTEKSPIEEQVDESRTIEVIKESSVEELLAPAAETPAVTEAAMEGIETGEFVRVDEPLIEDQTTGSPKELVVEALAEESPVLVQEPPVSLHTEVVAPVPEVTVPEGKAPPTQSIDATPIIDEDAIDAAAVKPTELPTSTIMAEEREETTASNEHSSSNFDDDIVLSNGSAAHVFGVANGNGLGPIIPEKETAGEEDAKRELFTPAPEPASVELPEGVPALVKED